MNEAQEAAGIISFVVFVVGIITITLSTAYAVAKIIMLAFGL